MSDDPLLFRFECPSCKREVDAVLPDIGETLICPICGWESADVAKIETEGASRLRYVLLWLDRRRPQNESPENALRVMRACGFAMGSVAGMILVGWELIPLLTTLVVFAVFMWVSAVLGEAHWQSDG